MKEPVGLASLVVLLPALLMGVIYCLTVRTRRGVLFGVSVPLSFSDSPEAKRVTALYRSGVMLLTVVAAASCIPALMRSLPWFSVFAMPCLVVGGMVLWQVARQKIKAHQIVPPLERHAGISVDSGASIAWFAAMAAALAPLAGTWFYLQSHLNEIPARFPIHWDFNGVANGWATRSGTGVATPLWIGAAVVTCMICMAAFIRLAPATDRQRITHVMFPIFTSIAWSLSLVFCWVALMPLHRATNPSSFVIVMVGQLVVVLGIVVWMIWRMMRTQGMEAYDGTPDSMWHAGGMVYYNPSDAAVFVPKRLGWGWALNFGRPAAWLYIGIVLLIAVGIGILPFVLK